MPSVVTMGETMVRFSTPPGVSLEDAPVLEMRVAGSESNVAIGVARMGIESGWISCLVDHPLGRRVVNSVRLHGVDTTAVVWRESGRIPLYFIEMGLKPRGPQVYYDREHSPFREAEPDEVNWAYLQGASFFHTSGISAFLNTRLAERGVREAKARGLTVSVDVNYRAKLASPHDFLKCLSAILPQADLLFSTADDARVVFGVDGDPDSIARVLAERLGFPSVVVTDGSRGAVLWDRGQSHRVGGFALEEVDRVGAGDAFVAGFLAGMHEEGPSLGLRYGSAYAALKHTYLGDIAWVTRTQVRQLALQQAVDTWR